MAVLLANPGEIIQIWHGGIAIYGGVIAGAATVYWFAKKEKYRCITLRHLWHLSFYSHKQLGVGETSRTKKRMEKL